MKFGFELPTPGRTAARAPRPTDEVPVQEPMRGADRAARRKPDADQKKVRRQQQRDQQAQNAGRRTASNDIPDQASTATKEHQMSYQRREAEILRTMATASLSEQRNLAVELEFIRSERQASLQASRDVDLADSVIRDTMTPVRVHEHHTAATDWILESPSGGQDFDHSMRATATMWFSALHPAVVAEREEFNEQARGMARREAGRFGEDAPQAGRVFLDTVSRLRTKATGEVDHEQSGNAESTVTDYDTKTDQDPMWAEDWDKDAEGVHPEMPGATGGRRTAATYTCVHCDRTIAYVDGRWVDPQADGDDSVWRETCDANDTFTAEHEPAADWHEGSKTAGEVPEAFKKNWNKDGDDDSEDDDVKNGDKPWEKESSRKTAVNVSKVKIKDKADNTFTGTTDDGATVTFRLSDGDANDVRSVMFGDLGMNFSGLEIEQSDIVKDASRRTAGEYQGGSPKAGDTATCHKDGGKIEFFDGQWYHLKGGPSHNDVHPATAKEKADKEARRHTAAGGWKVQVTGVGENVWSQNSLTFATEAEAKAYASNLAGRWFGMDMARVVPVSTPNREAVDPSDPAIVLNYRTASRRHAAEGGHAYDNGDAIGGGWGPKDVPCLECGKDANDPVHLFGTDGRYSSLRQAAEGMTCSVCGDKIAKDPAGEDPSTYHHDNGEKHDHEAKPSGDYEDSKKAASRRMAGRWMVRLRGRDLFARMVEADSEESAIDAADLTGDPDAYADPVGGKESRRRTAGEVPESFKKNWDKDSGDDAEDGGDDVKNGDKPWEKDASAHTAGDTTKLATIPDCDVCLHDEGRGGVQASYDGATVHGPWAYMCERHFATHGVGLGTGAGQRLVQASRKTATYYCTSCDVYVGDGNRDTHSGDDHKVEQRKSEENKESRLAAGRGNDFSMSDAKNEDGEWIMSPEEIRAEMSYSDEEDPDDFYRDAVRRLSAKSENAQRLAAFRARVASTLGRTASAASQCVYSEETNHSDDLVEVYTGSTTPTLICGYHEMSRGVPSRSQS